MHLRSSPIRYKTPQKIKLHLRVRIVTIRKVIMKTVMKMREEGCMEICKEEASGSGNQQFSFEIGRASSGQSVTCFMFISISQRKRSLPLRCFKGKNIIIVLIISYLSQFFQNGKISRYSHVLCTFQFHDQIKGG